MCSRDEIIMFSEPVLFPSIPITYVITMEGSERYKQLLHELNTYRPTRKVVIVHHKSMTDCARPQWVTKPSKDIWNNTLMIAKRDPNMPVLILEDDVHFLPRVYDYAKYIDETVANNKCELYSLGMACFLCFPLIHDIRVVLAGGTQAVLYSANGRQRLVREYGDNASYKNGMMQYLATNLGFTWLHDGEIYYEFHTLAPKEPCAVQSLPVTENQKEWGSSLIDIVFFLTGAREDGTTLFELTHAISFYFFGIIPIVTLTILVFSLFVVCLKRNRTFGTKRILDYEESTS